jgi:hypothetical protein
MDTAEPLLTDPSPFEVEIAIDDIIRCFLGFCAI